MNSASALAPGRWRCHAAAAEGLVHVPALVTVYEDGSTEVSTFGGETHSTRDINAVVMVVKPDAVPTLPPTLPVHGLRPALTALAHLTVGGTLPISIPLSVG
ncbi:MAG: hypothetical protein K2K49_03270 [Duncaniella sp.]|nr:hypothetical protein [Duncaniella sp.]